MRQDVGLGPGILVDPLVGECIPDIHDGEKPGRQRNGLSAQPAGVAAAVPFLVVAPGYVYAGLEKRYLFEQATPDVRMRLHQMPFVGIELSRLDQDRIRDAYLADVVQRRAARN